MPSEVRLRDDEREGIYISKLIRNTGESGTEGGRRHLGQLNGNLILSRLGLKDELYGERKFAAHHTPCALNTELEAERAS